MNKENPILNVSNQQNPIISVNNINVKYKFKEEAEELKIKNSKIDKNK